MLGALAFAYLSLRMNTLIGLAEDSWGREVPARAGREIVASGPVAMPFLAVAMQNPRQASWQVDEAYAEIGGSTAYPLLRKLAESDDAHIANCATWAIGATRDRRALGFLLGKLVDKRDQLVAAHALGELQCQESIPKLVRLLGEGIDGGGDAGPSLGRTSAQALAKIGGAGAEALAVALIDPASSLNIRTRAAIGLTLAKDPRTRQRLAQFVQSAPDEEALGHAVLALAELKDMRAFPLAAKWVEMDNGRTDIGLIALLELGDSRSMRIVEKAINGPEDKAINLAMAAKTSSNPISVSLLIRLAKRPERRVQYEAIWALHDIGDPVAVHVLEKLWPTAGYQQGDIEAALSRMHRSGAAALTRIYHHVTDVAHRLALLQLLGESDEPSASPILGQAITDADSKVREQARSALLRLFLRY